MVKQGIFYWFKIFNKWFNVAWDKGLYINGKKII